MKEPPGWIEFGRKENKNLEINSSFSQKNSAKIVSNGNAHYFLGDVGWGPVIGETWKVKSTTPLVSSKILRLTPFLFLVFFFFFFFFPILFASPFSLQNQIAMGHWSSFLSAQFVELNWSLDLMASGFRLYVTAPQRIFWGGWPSLGIGMQQVEKYPGGANSKRYQRQPCGQKSIPISHVAVSRYSPQYGVHNAMWTNKIKPDLLGE